MGSSPSTQVRTDESRPANALRTGLCRGKNPVIRRSTWRWSAQSYREIRGLADGLFKSALAPRGGLLKDRFADRRRAASNLTAAGRGG